MHLALCSPLQWRMVEVFYMHVFMRELFAADVMHIFGVFIFSQQNGLKCTALIYLLKCTRFHCLII